MRSWQAAVFSTFIEDKISKWQLCQMVRPLCPNSPIINVNISNKLDRTTLEVFNFKRVDYNLEQENCCKIEFARPFVFTRGLKNLTNIDMID